MNPALSMIIFKGKSKNGNDYYILMATIIVDNHLIKVSGLIFENVALDLQKKGITIIEKKARKDN